MGNGAWLAALALVACGSEAPSTDENANRSVIRIGVFLDQGGSAPAEHLAVREINEASGIEIDGVTYDLELVSIPHGGSAAGGVAAVEQFIEQGVVAAVGPPWSSIMLGDREDHSDGAARAAIDGHLLLVSATATAEAISDLEDSDLIWRTIPPDELQGEAGAQFTYDQGGARKAAVLYRDDAWGKGLSASFERSFTDLGGDVLMRIGYAPGAQLGTYAFPELEQVFEGMPDVVYIAAFDELAQITNRIAQEDYLASYGDEPPLLFATDGSYFDDLLVNGDPDVLSLVVGTAPAPDQNAAAYMRFASAYETANARSSNATDSYEYDAVYLIALAIQAAASPDSAAFKKKMREISTYEEGDEAIGVAEWSKAKAALLAGKGVDYEGASGPVSFTAAGDPGAGRYTVWSIVSSQGGALAFEEKHGVTFGM